RVIVHDFVTNIFAPVFFASLGLRADFVASFDLRLCALVFVIASGAKIIGCTLGARAGGMRWRPSAAVGMGLNARGAMEIILALLALEAGLLKTQVFVALVTMALLTSLISGPTMRRMLRGENGELLSALIARGAWVRRLSASTPAEVIEELVAALARPLAGLGPLAARAVLDREALASTGLGNEVAVPHAVVPGLQRPLLAVGLAPSGVDFNAPDGRPSKVVFLLLMPPRAHDQEVRILAQIARVVIHAEGRARLLAAESLNDVLACVAPLQLPEPRPDVRASLADI
ncbi:MAG: PTS sugar transporter subunit IIA, partial [Polyangiaceae bacterium]|nr:PTS sugar transporter subunit IIA [Polyangiaceae bacterium]